MSRTFKKLSVVLIALVAVISLGACDQQVQVVAAPAGPDYAAELGPASEAFMAAWNAEDVTAFDAILAPDFQRMAPDQNANGLDEMKAFVEQAHTAYTGFHLVVDESAFAENSAFLHWTVTGTFTPESGDGVPVEVSGITLLHFADGKITQEIAYYDTASLMEQVGAAALPHAE